MQAEPARRRAMRCSICLSNELRVSRFPLSADFAQGGQVMATPSWKVSGQYYETCNCDFVCPCVPGQMAVRPTKGACAFAMAFQIDRGSYGTLSLDGLGFIVLAWTPEEMG